MIGLLEKIRNELPLEISFCSWDEITLVISGKNWSFSTQSAWRLVKNGSIHFGCLDPEAKSVCPILHGAQLAGVEFKTQDKPVDLAFYLSNDLVLEIFCTQIIEPWIIDLPMSGVFVGNS